MVIFQKYTQFREKECLKPNKNRPTNPLPLPKIDSPLTSLYPNNLDQSRAQRMIGSKHTILQFAPSLASLSTKVHPLVLFNICNYYICTHGRLICYYFVGQDLIQYLDVVPYVPLLRFSHVDFFLWNGSVFFS